MAAVDIDLIQARLPGRELHELLAAARRADEPITVNLFGMPARVIARFEDLRAFFLADDRFPAGATYEMQTQPVVGDTFINMDGARHDAYRQLTTPAFRSRAVARFVDDDLVPLAHEIVDRFAGRGEGDLVGEFARVLPFWAISRKLGLPMGSEDDMRRLALAQLTYPSNPEGALAAAAEVAAFLEPILDDRRAHPREDVLSHLLHAERNGQRLTEEEVVSHVRLLYSVGATTTSDAMSSLLRLLLTEPGLYERAAAEPELRPAIVHELLRYEPPVPLLPRLIVDGGQIGGAELAPGTMVLAGIAGANRDPAVFADPDHFDPDRGNPEILTFGWGSKFCPGSHLARQQLLAALEVLVERLPELQLVAAADHQGAILRSVPSVEARWAA